MVRQSYAQLLSKYTKTQNQSDQNDQILYFNISRNQYPCYTAKRKNQDSSNTIKTNQKA